MAFKARSGQPVLRGAALRAAVNLRRCFMELRSAFPSLGPDG
jgi:hypothetical protein